MRLPRWKMASVMLRFAFCLTLALVLDRLLRLISFSGVHRNVYAHYPGPCSNLPGIVDGAEDIVTASNGIAFISSGVAKILTPGREIHGKIFTFDFNNPDEPPKDVRIEGQGIQTKEWVPAGIDIWETGPKDNLKISLYVVNRQPDNIGIEVFDYLFDDGLPILRHKKTIRHKNIWKPNDVVLLDENHFYVTNDGYLGDSLSFLEMLFSLRFANVAFFDGKEARITADSLKMANGINLSSDKKLLYVAESIGQAIRIYKTSGNGDIELLKVIELSTVPDNINVDEEDGSLWVGCVPSVYQFFLNGKGLGQVLNIQLSENLEPTVREVFVDDTGLIEFSSVASRFGRAMLIGTPPKKAAYCELLAY